MLKEENLAVGMFLTPDQIYNICGVYLFLEDYSPIKGGKLLYFTTDKDDPNTYNIMKEYKGHISTAYKDADYLDEEVAFFG